MYQYPEWLGHDLVAGTLPWEQALPSSLSAFLERFTLSESRWIGLYTETDHNATLLLRWAAVRAEGALPGGATGWLLLAIRFDALERADVKLRESTIASALSGAATRAADWHRTQLEDRRGGSATLLHAPNVRLLCLTRARLPLPLPVPAATL